jgi:Bacteriophage tail sheath protein
MSATIVQAGSFNSASVVVPNLYVQIQPPAPSALNGSPTNTLGLVGSASWGPVNLPAICSGVSDYTAQFGPINARKYDMGTAVAVATLQGASFFKCVRVTDGTDVAATATLGTTWLTLTAKYTGSVGNNITVTWGAGAKSGTSRVTVSAPGFTPEVFDNIAGSANALAVAAAAAINSGAGVLRGASNLIVASAGAGTTAPAAGTSATLTGGTDGAASVAGATLVGQDTTPREGMYALRKQGCSVLNLVDCDDSTQWTTIEALALSEGMYAIVAGPSGDTISNAISAKETAGLDSYAVKLQFGDWCYWNDTYNQRIRLVSPASFIAGLIANLTPNNSTLNKPLLGIVGTQKSGAPGTPQAGTYSDADLQTLFLAGIDVIANPCPGGYYYGNRGGFNTSSNSAINGDNYTRMTNFIAATFAAGLGIYDGQPITNSLIYTVKSVCLNTCRNLLGQGLLTQFPGGPLPFSVQCDTPAAKQTNNPLSRVSLGYLQVDIMIQYQSINQKFIVNLTGGQSVVPATTVTAA